jgi:hypothetical protein
MCWTISSEQYVKAAIVNVEAKFLVESGQQLPTRCTLSLQGNYIPGFLDVSAEFNIEGVQYYQE